MIIFYIKIEYTMYCHLLDELLVYIIKDISNIIINYLQPVEPSLQEMVNLDLRYLTDDHKDINILLEFACYYNNTELALLLLSRDATMTAEGLDNICVHNNMILFKHLFPQPVELLNANIYFNDAAINGNMEMVELLINYGVTDFEYGLAYGCCYKNKKIIELMLSLGAKDFNLALRLACRGGSEEIASMMIDKGANSFEHGLEEAASAGHLHMIKFMMRCGAVQLTTGYYLACEKGHKECALFLLQQEGVDIGRGFNCACRYGHLDIIKSIIDIAADKYAFDFDIALLASTENNNIEVIDFLVSKSGNLNDALHSAVEYGNISAVKKLISYGATNIEAERLHAFELYRVEIYLYLESLSV